MKNLFSLALVGSLPISVFALPDYEPFTDATPTGGTSYTTGANLVGQNDGAGHSWFQAGSALPTFTVASGSLSYSGLAASLGNSVSLGTQNNIAARYSIGSAINANGSSLYYSFLLQIPDIGSTLGAGGGFVAGFNNTGAASQNTSPTVLGARTLIRSVGGGTGFNIGLSKASSSASDFTFGASPTTFSSSDTVFVVAAYDINVLGTAGDDSVRMWINPTPADFGAGSAPTPTLQSASGADMITAGSIQSFLLYGRPSNLFPNQMLVDELRIGSSWADVTPGVPEPSTAALLGLGIFGIGSVYRRTRRTRRA